MSDPQSAPAGVVCGRVSCVRLSEDESKAYVEPGTAEPYQAADHAVGRAVCVRAATLPARSGCPDWFIEFSPDARGWRHCRGKLATIFVLCRCTAHCVMCHVQDVYSGADMFLWRIFELLEELRMLGYDRIDYFGGEPTLRPDLPDMIAAATRLGCHTDIITNGMMLDRKLAARLRESGLRLAMVSLDAPWAEVHDRIRGVRGGFRKALAGIRALAQVAGLRARSSRRRMEVNIDTVVLPENMELLEEQIELAADLGATHVNFFLCVSAPLLAHRPMWLDKISAHRLFAEILPRCRETAMRRHITFTMSPDAPSSGGGRAMQGFLDAVSRGIYGALFFGGESCAAPRDEIYVTLNGDVFPCTSPTMLETKHRMGNAFKRPISGIIAGALFRRFGRRAGRYEECRMCWRAHSTPREETRYLGASARA